MSCDQCDTVTHTNTETPFTPAAMPALHSAASVKTVNISTENYMTHSILLLKISL